MAAGFLIAFYLLPLIVVAATLFLYLILRKTCEICNLLRAILQHLNTSDPLE